MIEKKAAVKVLEIEGLSKSFGGVKAVDNLSLSVDQGQICAIIGPNGSGKTTSINLITGVLKPTSGIVRFEGQDITGYQRANIAQLGVTRTFQNLRLWNSLPVIDHVLAARFCRTKSGLFPSVFRTRGSVREEKANLNLARELLALVGLSGLEDKLAPSLPYGKRRLLEIARALATEPRLLLLDEPAAGMSGGEINQLINLIFEIRRRGISVVVIEHRMQLVMKASDKIIVLNYGEKIAEGTADQIRRNEMVIQAYLGTAYSKDVNEVRQR
jgi:branched-chain amino acid transport system ATP-binding protein